MRPEHEKIARGCLLLANVPKDVADTVLAHSRLIEFERGATVFLQGEPADAVFLVAEGWVKLYRLAPNGTEAVVGVFTRGHSFGEAVAFQHDTYPVGAEAVTDCTLIRLDANTIRREIRESPETALAILSATFVHLHSLVSQVEQLKSQTGAQRVAEFLLELAPCRAGSCTVTLPYDKVLIAGRLGMKPESLSRAFAKLRNEGVRVRQNHAVIADIAALRDYVEDDPAQAWAKA